jgi:hypothetical protein
MLEPKDLTFNVLKKMILKLQQIEEEKSEELVRVSICVP